jgi:hypothetical protein
VEPVDNPATAPIPRVNGAPPNQGEIQVKPKFCVQICVRLIHNQSKRTLSTQTSGRNNWFHIIKWADTFVFALPQRRIRTRPTKHFVANYIFADKPIKQEL